MQLIYFWAKKIHNIAMWFAIALGVPVAITGVIIEGERGTMFFDASQLHFIREIHGEWSSKFALVLAIMMTTGFLMWVLPRLLSRSVKK